MTHRFRLADTPPRLRPSFWSALLFWAGLALGIGSAPQAEALTVVPPTFSKLVGDATQILRVEVTGVTSREDTAAGRKVIHTYVECRVLKTLKGGAAETVTLRMLGGQVGKLRLRVADMPEFTTGGKYIVFVRDNGAAFCPLVGVMHGSYPLVTEANGKTERVTRSTHEPLRRVADIGQPVQPGEAAAAAARTATAASATAKTSGATAEGLTRDEFETAIQQELSRAHTQPSAK
jgi:hypothetical protein